MEVIYKKVPHKIGYPVMQRIPTALEHIDSDEIIQFIIDTINPDVFITTSERFNPNKPIYG